MGMNWIDWSIVIGSMIFVTYMAVAAKKHTKSVADFLAASRCAGRYVLGTAETTVMFGAITLIYYFEIFTKTGFTRQFWETVTIPISTILVLSGFVLYRYRATRVMTMAQFFEMRYSRRFRIFAGIIAWISGIINFGIFPGVAARFFINFCGFPNYSVTVGPLDINLTLAAVMLVLISVALYFTFSGGQITILVTDFWQGIICTIVLFFLVTFICFKFPWSAMSESLVLASKPGESLIDPFDIGGKKDFNLTFFAIIWFGMVYGYMAWQSNQAYSCSASTPHEAKMSKVVGSLRALLVVAAILTVPLAALVVLHHPDHAEKAVLVNDYLQETFPDNESLQNQMRVPVALKNILPVGLLGGFAAAMLAFFISTNNTAMHAWGSIFVQDVVCVLRKKPLSPIQHIWYLRMSIVFVALFSFFFSLLFPLKEYIYMFLMITGAIYLGGAGSVIIGGLYWKKGSTVGAWCAMIVGSSLSVSTIVLRVVWPHIPVLVERFGTEFPYNSQLMAFGAAIAAIVTYVFTSLLSNKTSVDFDRLFHRGKYALKEEKDELEARGAEHKPVGRFWKLIGVNSDEFSRLDKGLFLYVAISTGFWVVSFVVLLLLGLAGWMKEQYWLSWWKFVIYYFIVTSFPFAIWFSIGGFFDLHKMYKKLASVKRDARDDGRVVGDHLLADEDVPTTETKA